MMRHPMDIYIGVKFIDVGGQIQKKCHFSQAPFPIARQNFLMPSCWNESTEALTISLKMQRCMEHAVS